MQVLLCSPAFWFGALLLCVHQGSKFSQIDRIDPVLIEYSNSIPNLHASDFAGRLLFVASLSIYIFLTFSVYTALCVISPDIIRGWLNVTRQHATGPTEGLSYTLYIAATLMGVTQTQVPGLTSLSDLQKGICHSLAGIPRNALEATNYYFNQIVSRNQDNESLGRSVSKIISDVWIKNLSLSADALFFRTQIARLKLDDDEQIADALQGSRRELKGIIEQLVYAAALSTIRKSGTGGLPRLAELLKVNPVPARRLARDFLVSSLLCVAAMTIVWLLVPMLDGFAAAHLRSGRDFWPATLPLSGQYLIAQAVPVFVAACMTFSYILNANESKIGYPPTGDAASLIEEIGKHISLFIAIMLIVICYDFGQALYDFGYFRSSSDASIWTYIPIYILHSFITIGVSFQIIVFFKKRTGTFYSSVEMALFAAAISAFYAASRCYYQYDHARAWDFVSLIVFLNVTSALLTLPMAAVFRSCRSSSGIKAERKLTSEAPRLSPGSTVNRS